MDMVWFCSWRLSLGLPVGDGRGEAERPLDGERAADAPDGDGGAAEGGVVAAAGGGVDERPEALHGDVEGLGRHVGEADAEPAGLAAVARRPGGDVEADLEHHLLPELHLAGERPAPHQVAHVHPAEEAGVAGQAPNADLPEPVHELVVPLLDPPLVLRDVAPGEVPVAEQRREEVLRLGRHEAEAGHLGRRGHDGGVGGVDGADAEPREAQVLGQAVHDVHAVGHVSAAAVAPGHDLERADEARGRLGERRAGVDLVADEVDALGGDEVDDRLEVGARRRGAERVGRVGDQHPLDAQPALLRAAGRVGQRGARHPEPVRARAVHGYELRAGAPLEVAVEPASTHPSTVSHAPPCTLSRMVKRCSSSGSASAYPG